jgi:hypothetical protein
MEGVPPGANMEDQHERMLEEKVCKQPEHINFEGEAFNILIHTDRYFVHVN